MDFKLIKVNHFRLLATIIINKELNLKQMMDCLPFKKCNIVSYLTFLRRYKLVDVRYEHQHNANFIFYSATQSGVELIELLKDAIDSVSKNNNVHA